MEKNVNLELYNKVRSVPEKAKKQINAGRLKGMTDIKPIWRIEKLTEIFGPCGIGWKAPITKKEIIEGANGEKIAIVDIELFYKTNGEWSEGVQGTGGSSFVSKESKGLYTSDECFKMAYSDALSVACRSLGFGADVYWGNNNDTKYGRNEEPKNEITTLEQALNYKLTFGKCVGKTLKEIVDTQKDYANWLYKNGDDTIKQCLEIILQNIPNNQKDEIDPPPQSDMWDFKK